MELVPAQTAALIPASEPRCIVCRHDRRQEIEEALMHPGASMRSVARRFGLILANLQRHRPHMGAALDAARALREVEGVSELYKRQKATATRLREMAEKAFETGQYQAAAQLMEVARKHEEMLSKFAQTPGFRDVAPQTNINAPEARILVTPMPRRALLPAEE